MTEDYGNDLVVLSGFSGQPMGDVGGYGDPQDFIAEQFIDAAAGTPEGEFEATDDDGDFRDVPVISEISTGM